MGSSAYAGKNPIRRVLVGFGKSFFAIAASLLTRSLYRSFRRGISRSPGYRARCSNLRRGLSLLLAIPERPPHFPALPRAHLPPRGRLRLSPDHKAGWIASGSFRLPALLWLAPACLR